MNKVALITGASRGIGKAIALKLAKRYDCIAITSFHNSEDLEATKNELLSLGVECIARTGDSGDYAFVKDFVSEIVNHWGRIDALVNNVGISYIGLISDLSIEEWTRILNTNLSSAFYYCHEVSPHMVHEHGGRILNISSVWGEVGASCEVAYSTTKGGLNALTQALGKELAPSGIAVNAISCGAINTQMNACFSAEELADLEADIPFGRMSTPEEVADFALTILQSPLYLTAQIIRFDGGWI